MYLRLHVVLLRCDIARRGRCGSAPFGQTAQDRLSGNFRVDMSPCIHVPGSSGNRSAETFPTRTQLTRAQNTQKFPTYISANLNFEAARGRLSAGHCAHALGEHTIMTPASEV